MATGGIFTLITNDGKQDRILMATQFLHDRLAEIHATRFARNRETVPAIQPDDARNLPSLLDIEKTHILFTNAHFKPYAAIGFEYNKVNPNSGSAQFGDRVQFSIPQFGDFFHDIAVHVILQQPTLTSTASAPANAPAMRWCSWPGERLLKKVTQDVNGNPLDDYTCHATVFHREYKVAPHKLAGWRRCVGQEEGEQAFLRQNNMCSTEVGPEDYRVGTQVFSGNQTPSGQKVGQLEMFIPLNFWYNKDVRLAVPSVAIPYGQRFIYLEFAAANELVGLVPRGNGTWSSPNGSLSTPTISKVELYINNIFMNPEVHKIYIKRVGFSLIRVHREQRFTLNKSSDDLLLQNMKWPIEYLFVGCKMQDYFMPSSAALMARNLDCWDKFSYYQEKQYMDSSSTRTIEVNLLDPTAATVTAVGVGTAPFTITLTGAKITGSKNSNVFSAETGISGTATSTGGTASEAVTALPSGSIIRVNSLEFTTSGETAVGATVITATTTTAAITSGTVVTKLVKVVTVPRNEYIAKRWLPTLSTLSITAHSIDIYKEFPAAFFNAYTPYHYGGPNINTPSDVGALFVPFCLYPGTYQPSGHINVSRAREFYLKYQSDVFNSYNTGLCCIMASAINFLLITDGSAVLRYST